MSAPEYLTLAEAAAVLKIKLKTFRRHVLPHLTPIRISAGTIRITREDIDSWAARAKAGDSALPEKEDRTTPSASPIRRVRKGSSERGRAMLSKLRASPKTSTDAA